MSYSFDPRQAHALRSIVPARRFAIVATSKHANHVACCFARALLCLVAAQCDKQVRMCCFTFKGLSCAVNAVSRLAAA